MFVAPSATVVGNVTIAKGASVWYGAVLRGKLASVFQFVFGKQNLYIIVKIITIFHMYASVTKIFSGDESYIKIESGATIGDRVMVHCANHPKEFPTIVGKNALVNAGAILHGCVVEEGAVVGEGSQILDGAKVCQNAVVTPGSLLGMGKTVPAGQVWGGVPARYLRNVTEAELARAAAAVTENALLAAEHGQETAKSWETIELEEYDYEQKTGRNENYYRRLTPKVWNHFVYFFFNFNF